MDGRGVRFICSVETQALECPVRYVVLLRETVTVRYRYNLLQSFLSAITR